MSESGNRAPEIRQVERLADELVKRLTRAGRTIAVAESLTGGLLAATIVAVPGASACFRGGVVAYATDTKASVLGVEQELLDRAGPVDAEVAAQMASGVAKLYDADVGLSTTGVAGPGPSGGHAPGTVYVGLATAVGASSAAFSFAGNRDAVRNASVLEALTLVLR